MWVIFMTDSFKLIPMYVSHWKIVMFFPNIIFQKDKINISRNLIQVVIMKLKVVFKNILKNALLIYYCILIIFNKNQ